MRAQWQREKEIIEQIRKAQPEIEELRREAEQAQRTGRSRDGRRDHVREDPRAREEDRGAPQDAREGAGEDELPARRGHRRGHRRRSSRSGRASPSPRCSRARCTSSSTWRRSCKKRVVGQDEARRGGRQRGAALARGARRSEPAHRLLPLPRSDRRRQDRARAGARRVPVRRRARDDSPRHERVHGEARGLAPHRRAARATSATRRAASSPSRCAAGRTPSSSSTRSRRRTRTSGTCCSRCSTTVASPTARAARSTSRTPSSS